MLDTAFTGIKALIMQLPANQYEANQIIKGYTNNATVSSTNNYVIMTEINATHSNAEIPVYHYSVEEEQQSFANPEYTNFQVDFYGSNARTTAQQFRLTLQSLAGNQFLLDYNASVNKVDELINLTHQESGLNMGPAERSQYLTRYAARFSLFITNAITIDYPSFTVVNDNLFFIP